MSYFQDVDAWLDELLKYLPSPDDIKIAKREIKEKILESYRNGQKACPKCHGAGKSRGNK